MQTVIFVKFTSFMSSRLKLSQNKRCLSSILKPDGKVIVWFKVWTINNPTWRECWEMEMKQ